MSKFAARVPAGPQESLRATGQWAVHPETCPCRKCRRARAAKARRARPRYGQQQ